jgi:hypothetical protein
LPAGSIEDLDNELIDDSWVADMIGAHVTSSKLPTGTQLQNDLSNGGVGWTRADETGTVTLAPSPEPGTLTLFGMGAVSLLARERRRRTAKR